MGFSFVQWIVAVTLECGAGAGLSSTVQALPVRVRLRKITGLPCAIAMMAGISLDLD